MRRPDPRPAPSGFSPSFLAEGQAILQRRTSRTVTEEDAREAAHNLTGVFALLLEWKRERIARENGAAAPAPDPTGETE
jgi:hypothetical protein